MRKVLIVASGFPPRGEGNVLRVVKFVKLLPHYGWKPYVLTISESSIAKIDHSHEHDLSPELNVYRAFYPNLFLFLDKHWVKKSQLKDIVTYQTAKETTHSNSLRFPGKKVVLKLIRFIRKNFFVPEELATWLPFAVFKGVHVCRKENIDIIFSTVPAYVNHLVALFIKKLTGKKWVADYRDLWIGYPTRKITGFRRKLEEKIEQIVLKSADVITIVSEPWREFLLKRYPFLSPDKIVCIPNGYDAEDFKRKETKQQNKNVFSITYTGKIFKEYPTPLLLRILGEVCHEYPEMREKLQVNFYGEIHEEQQPKIEQVIQKFQLNEIVHLNGKVPREKALKASTKSSLLLLMYIGQGENIQGCIPAKLFEYIGAQRPILAIVPPDGAAAKIVKEGNCGLVVSPDDYQGIKQCLIELYQRFISDDLKFDENKEYLNRFDRRNLTWKLSSAFNSLIRLKFPAR